MRNSNIFNALFASDAASGTDDRFWASLAGGIGDDASDVLDRASDRSNRKKDEDSNT